MQEEKMSERQSMADIITKVELFNDERASIHYGIPEIHFILRQTDRGKIGHLRVLATAKQEDREASIDEFLEKLEIQDHLKPEIKQVFFEKLKALGK